MTPDPLVVSENDTLLEAFELMRNQHVRRLPVVTDGTLRGMLTLTDLYKCVEPTSLHRDDVGEHVERHLESRRVSEVMTAAPITCGPNDYLEDVGQIMSERGVAGLPVIQSGELVGIITESNVLGAFTALTRCGGEGARVYFRVPRDEKIDVFYRITDLARARDLEVLTVMSHGIGEDKDQLVLVRARGRRVQDFVEQLWESGFQVLSVD